MQALEIPMQVNLSNLLESAAKDCKNPAISFGFAIANGALVRMAKHAIATKDEFLLEELRNLGYIVDAWKPA